jgi:hypothetical protein
VQGGEGGFGDSDQSSGGGVELFQCEAEHDGVERQQLCVGVAGGLVGHDLG